MAMWHRWLILKEQLFNSAFSDLDHTKTCLFFLNIYIYTRPWIKIAKLGLPAIPVMSAAVGLVTAVRVIAGTEGEGEAASSGIPGEIISLVPKKCT